MFYSKQDKRYSKSIFFDYNCTSFLSTRSSIELDQLHMKIILATHPFIEPLMVLEFLAQDCLYSIVQRGGVGHVQVAGDPDGDRLAEVETLGKKMR